MRSRLPVVAITGLALVLTVPAVAEPSEWQVLSALGIGEAEEHAELIPMPFETAGESFPGSAFYYLEDAPRLAFDVDELRGSASDEVGSGETVSLTRSHGVDGAARSFVSAGSGLDKARALQCLSMAVYYEAANESRSGQRAVAQVVLNRVAHPSYPASVCGVVFQGSERRTGCQFTFTCDGSLARKPSRRSWAGAQSVALAALAGDVFAPVDTATHYHATYVNPYWAPSLDHVGTIGLHRFYRWKGRAGKADAFSITYSGGEPAAARSRQSSPSRSNPSQLQASTSALAETPPANMAAIAEPGAAPAEQSDRLPASGSVKPEYARSGRWINEPGKANTAR